MDSSLPEIWQAAGPNSAFHPTVPKDLQFYIAALLLVFGLSITGGFALDRSFASIPTLGVPAAGAIALGTVFMFCAVGVHV